MGVKYKMHGMEIECKFADGIQMTRFGVQWRAFLNMVIDNGELLDQLSDYQSLKKDDTLCSLSILHFSSLL
jgi:hypothetical protein